MYISIYHDDRDKESKIISYSDDYYNILKESYKYIIQHGEFFTRESLIKYIRDRNTMTEYPFNDEIENYIEDVDNFLCKLESISDDEYLNNFPFEYVYSKKEEEFSALWVGHSDYINHFHIHKIEI